MHGDHVDGRSASGPFLISNAFSSAVHTAGSFLSLASENITEEEAIEAGSADRPTADSMPDPRPGKANWLATMPRKVVVGVWVMRASDLFSLLMKLEVVFWVPESASSRKALPSGCLSPKSASAAANSTSGTGSLSAFCRAWHYLRIIETAQGGYDYYLGRDILICFQHGI